MSLNKFDREDRRRKMVGRMSYIREECSKRNIRIKKELKDGFLFTYHCNDLRYFPWTGTIQTTKGVIGKGAQTLFKLMEEEQSRH